MKIVEYLNTLDPKQQVMIVVENEEGRHLIADHEAAFLAASKKRTWRQLEVVKTVKRMHDIYIVTKRPAS